MAVREAEPLGSLQEVKEAGLDREDLLDIYRNMLITRGIEERGHILYKQGKIPGSFYTGKGNDNEWGQRYAEMLRRIMAADFPVVAQTYDRAAHLSLPGGRTEHGAIEADRFWVALRAAFPSAELVIEHRIGREDPLMPPRSAVRWSLVGKHEGKGLFGPPTGAEVHLRGASHAEWGPWGLRRDYVLFDEVHVWKQILLHQG